MAKSYAQLLAEMALQGTSTSDLAALLAGQGTPLPDAGLGPVTNTTRSGRPNPMLKATQDAPRPADVMAPVAETLSIPMGAYGAGQLVGGGINAMRDEDYASGAGQIALGMAGMLPMAPKGGKGIRAFHGSPHDFDRFDMSKIGTGEGNQAYGHGLYFADAEDVARTYRDRMQGKGVPDPKALAPDFPWSDDISAYAYRAIADDSVDPATAAKRASWRFSELRGIDLDPLEQAIKQGRDAYKGHMYEVRINADPADFLDWDKPLSQQSEKAREAALSAMERASGITRADLKEGVTGADAVRYGGINDSYAMTQALREAGIPGIRYLDQMSRGEGKGSSNYVVFDDNIIDIVKKYGIAGLALLQAAGYGADTEEPQTQ